MQLGRLPASARWAATCASGSAARATRSSATIRNPEVSDVSSLTELASALEGPRVVWVMVPAGAATQSTVDQLGELLEPGDTVVDGGNSAGRTTRSTRRNWPPRASGS